MASLFTHALVAVAAGKSFAAGSRTLKLSLLGMFCAVIPDADVLMFNFVDYEHFLGHRGFFHSLFFCLCLALLIMALFYRSVKMTSPDGLRYLLFFFFCGASHGLLDMLTNGGLGVALFSPFDNSRYFFPFRPIQVSPIGLSRFFSYWGLQVLKTELFWVGLPCLGYVFLLRFRRKGT